jgi:3',5'-cyclic AMP phosphodiesterase CpdA
MAACRKAFPFNIVLMTGDNIYGAEKPVDMKKKFEDAYKELLDQGVEFYASLGNHDAETQKFYKFFNMNGKEYYRIKKNDVSIYALNSGYLDKPQLQWLMTELAADNAKWKVAFFHHPPYSSGGRHGSDLEIRDILHPLFVKNRVEIVFTGHDHFYERIKPQDGITYFVAGAGGKLSKGDVKKLSPLTAGFFDADLSFMLLEFTADEMHYQVISRAGRTVDSGSIRRHD